MKYGRLVLVLLGAALVITGVIVGVASSEPLGLGLAVVGLVSAVLGASNWQEFEAQLSRLRFRVTAAPPPSPPPAPTKPLLVMGAASGRTSVERRDDGKRHLSQVEPEYLIENQGPTAVREIDTGVETFDGARSHTFPNFHVPALTPGQKQPVRDVGSIPREMLEGVHESSALSGHFYWATFEDAEGHRWKAIYDPRDRTHSYEVLARASDSG
jgi:hypothetical protein